MYTYTTCMDESSSTNRIADFFRTHHRMPTWREMMRMFRYRSPNAVTKLVDRLVESGALQRDATGRISLVNPFNHTRVLGTVEAGFPSPAEEELADTMSIDEWLIGNKEATFMLKVRGESMKDAGIMPGDMVLVERGLTARDGDIVIAEVDHAWTMKYLRHVHGRVVLEPANERFKPIYPTEDLSIAAVVKAVIRKY